MNLVEPGFDIYTSVSRYVAFCLAHVTLAELYAYVLKVKIMLFP